MSRVTSRTPVPRHHEGVRTLDLAALALLTLLAVAVAAAGWRRARRPARRADPDDGLDDGLDAGDLRALDDALTAVAAEHAGSLQGLLGIQLDRLRRRRVPVRAIRATSAPPVVRLCFADGTVIRARAASPGDWAPVVLAVAGTGDGVVVESHAVAGDEVEVILATPAGVRRRAVAVGLDQPD
jgi:hypothetical protein